MTMNNVYLLLLIPILSCTPIADRSDAVMYSSGEWQFALDRSDEGIAEKWYQDDLEDTVKLPGTTDTNRKRIRNRDTTTMHLNRLYRYEGAAWYRKIVMIPEDYRDRRIALVMERTKSSMVWVDSMLAGSCALLQSPQAYDLYESLSPGQHALTIRIDNSLVLTPYGNVHICTDETQTNWNGIIGKLFLQARPPTRISALKVTPDIDQQKIAVDLTIDNPLQIVQVIDNMERNHKLGMIFECRAGLGKLLVCTSRLPDIMDKPEAAQLYRSIIRYAGSDAFDPDELMEERELMKLLYGTP